MDIRSAEMTKYAANAMLATKISFINEVANICERVGADINNVRIGIGSDTRIGYKFIYPGCGYGGSCFPKDVSALINIAKEHDYFPNLISSVEEVNMLQKQVLFKKLTKCLGNDLKAKRLQYGVFLLNLVLMICGSSFNYFNSLYFICWRYSKFTIQKQLMKLSFISKIVMLIIFQINTLHWKKLKHLFWLLNGKNLEVQIYFNEEKNVKLFFH